MNSGGVCRGILFTVHISKCWYCCYYPQMVEDNLDKDDHNKEELKKDDFTASAPKPILSRGRDVRVWICCLSPPATTGTKRAGDFWLKSVSLTKNPFSLNWPKDQLGLSSQFINCQLRQNSESFFCLPS